MKKKIKLKCFNEEKNVIYDKQNDKCAINKITKEKKLKYKMLKRTTSTFSCKYEVIRDIENCI